MTALACALAGGAGAAHLGAGAASPLELTASVVTIPVPKAGGIVLATLVVRSTRAADVAAGSVPYRVRLAGGSAPGVRAIAVVHTTRTKASVMRTVLFVAVNRPARTASARLDGTRPQLTQTGVRFPTVSSYETLTLAIHSAHVSGPGHSAFARAIMARTGALTPRENGVLDHELPRLGDEGAGSRAWEPTAADVGNAGVDVRWLDAMHTAGWQLHDRSVVTDWSKLFEVHVNVDDLIRRFEQDLANDGPPPDSTGCTQTGDGTIAGTPGDDVICGGPGDDRCVAGAGNDTCRLGDGNNTCDLGPGNDRCVTGSGDDTCDGGPGNDVCDLGTGDNVCTAETCHGTTAPPPPPPAGTYACTGNSTLIFDGYNVFGVDNGGTPPSFSTGGQPYCIDLMATYHWNGGKGAPVGTTWLTSDLGQSGPWTMSGQAADGSPGDINWLSRPGDPTKAIVQGTVACHDSSPATWAQNAESGHHGFCRVWGRVAQKTG